MIIKLYINAGAYKHSLGESDNSVSGGSIAAMKYKTSKSMRFFLSWDTRNLNCSC